MDRLLSAVLALFNIFCSLSYSIYPSTFALDPSAVSSSSDHLSHPRRLALGLINHFELLLPAIIWGLLAHCLTYTCYNPSSPS
ncbi:hypothetical protein K523DRAFT_359148 [Schizophyllum commune Tattone D]|nr:hypothetical protein K523DRAFT_359148 [Schizophyllum commune Tattone D]